MGETIPSNNWFDQDGHSYALFRPEYPPELAAHLASLSAGRQRALDVGCGSGQPRIQARCPCLEAGHCAAPFPLSAGQDRNRA